MTHPLNCILLRPSYLPHFGHQLIHVLFFPPTVSIARSRPRLLITVITITLSDNFPFRNACIPKIASNSSPSTMSPFSSQRTRRSASPSCAIPIFAFSSLTAFDKVSGCSLPQPTLIFIPSGTFPIEMTSAPKWVRVDGVVL